MPVFLKMVPVSADMSSMLNVLVSALQEKHSNCRNVKQVEYVESFWALVSRLPSVQKTLLFSSPVVTLFGGYVELFLQKSVFFVYV